MSPQIVSFLMIAMWLPFRRYHHRHAAMMPIAFIFDKLLYMPPNTTYPG